MSDNDFLTQSIDPAKVTPLGQITFANLTKGTVETFNDPALTDFIRNYPGSELVTFILAAAPDYTSTGQARFASREAVVLEGDTGEEPGRFAPYLSFTTGGPVPEPLRITFVTRTGNELTIQWTGGAGPFALQKRTEVATGAWNDVVSGLNTTTATISLEGATGFFRVQGR